LTIDLGTELIPAVSFAYEEPESDIMTKRPRNSKKDRLVSRNLIIYAYGIAGLTHVAFALLAYFYTFLYHGIYPSDIFNSASIYITIIIVHLF
jgi:sodium/potassium-transporting ATPase subunit alpha